jgi:K+/H+ antiporter YhaU regulatory subunit KhtT
MYNEEIERKMNFIVEQQAQFASDIQQLQESQARTEQVVTRTAETVAQSAEAVGQTAETVAQMGEVLTRLANVTHAGFTEVNAKINALVDAQIRTEVGLARTDENLNSFIAAVDRRLREDRNGK